MTAPPYPHRLDRTMVIRAKPDTVFAFFTETPRWAAWWGPGSSIDARPGGRVLIIHSGGIEVSGEVRDVRPPERIAFTYGYASGTPCPPGSSLVTIRLEHHPEGTLLQLTHEFADEAARDAHVEGWRFQLSLFANLLANDASAAAPAIVDRWFAAWNEPDADRVRDRFAAIATAGVTVRDRFSTLDGVDDLVAHVLAGRRFMPPMQIARQGEIRHCQWHLLADWSATGSDGQPRGRGTTLFVLDQDGLLTTVVGF